MAARYLNPSRTIPIPSGTQLHSAVGGCQNTSSLRTTIGTAVGSSSCAREMEGRFAPFYPQGLLLRKAAVRLAVYEKVRDACSGNAEGAICRCWEDCRRKKAAERRDCNRLVCVRRPFHFLAAAQIAECRRAGGRGEEDAVRAECCMLF